MDMLIKIQLFPYAEGVGSMLMPTLPGPGQAAATRPFAFAPIEVELPLGSVIRVGRKIDKSKGASKREGPFNAPASFEVLGPLSHAAMAQETVDPQPYTGQLDPAEPVLCQLQFRSKVISRSHGEFVVGADAKVSARPASSRCTALAHTMTKHNTTQLRYRDVGSSSGSFIDRVRCSPSARESPLIPVESMQLMQLGVDYQCRTEDIFRAVGIKVVVSPLRSQPADVARRREEVHRLRSALVGLLEAVATHEEVNSDCCICLSALAPRQALFLSPCSHCFHFKCVSTLVAGGVMFVCPLCRQVANLDANVSDEPWPADTEVEVDMGEAAPDMTSAIGGLLVEEEDGAMTGVDHPGPTSAHAEPCATPGLRPRLASAATMNSHSLSFTDSSHILTHEHFSDSPLAMMAAGGTLHDLHAAATLSRALMHQERPVVDRTPESVDTDAGDVSMDEQPAVVPGTEARDAGALSPALTSSSSDGNHQATTPLTASSDSTATIALECGKVHALLALFAATQPQGPMPPELVELLDVLTQKVGGPRIDGEPSVR
jgi:hypothetical protein